ncbi:hypothetical protein CBW65_08910 [Tumebacillus avium]|uniref:Uncharacterized protein n=1 Tax=Tumebacillus avium TaxID=1903704 RepID=A0A1Y0IKW3_9BACL|nr:hypothetical protein [Tumebacillus avium]ARU61137.1 hypothetical protein CBW65_08910 [Tumebacillus avium]
MMAAPVLDMLEQFENISQCQAILSQIRELESEIKERVDEESWQLIIRWEELWVQILVEQQKHLLPKGDDHH